MTRPPTTVAAAQNDTAELRSAVQPPRSTRCTASPVRTRPWPESSGTGSSRFLVWPFELPHQSFEFAAAMFVALKLIEARTRRRKQNGIAGTRPLKRRLHRAVDGRAIDQRN